VTSEFRLFAWQAAESAFAELHIAVGTPFPVLLGIEVRKEEMIPPLRDALAKLEIQIADVIKKKWPFGRRWLVGARSQPRPILRAEIDTWLDTVEPILLDYDAELITWVPLVPAA
jgi:hypothetical protein